MNRDGTIGQGKRTIDVTAGERFFFEAFKIEEKPGEKVELVRLPELSISKPEYIGRVLINSPYYQIPERLLESIQRFLRHSRESPDYNSAILKFLRGTLNLDHSRHVRDFDKEITSPELQFYMNQSFLEASMHDFTDNPFESYRPKFSDQLIDAAMRVSDHVNHHVGLVARTLQDQEEFERVMYRIDRERGDKLQAALRSAERRRFNLLNLKAPEEIIQVAEVLLGEYPILHNRAIREQLSDPRDLSYTLCAAIAYEIIENQAYQEACLNVVKSNAPSRLKFVYSMMLASSDELLKLGKILERTTKNGYHGQPK